METKQKRKGMKVISFRVDEETQVAIAMIEATLPTSVVKGRRRSIAVRMALLDFVKRLGSSLKD